MSIQILFAFQQYSKLFRFYSKVPLSWELKSNKLKYYQPTFRTLLWNLNMCICIEIGSVGSNAVVLVPQWSESARNSDCLHISKIGSLGQAKVHTENQKSLRPNPAPLKRFQFPALLGRRWKGH